MKPFRYFNSLKRTTVLLSGLVLGCLSLSAQAQDVRAVQLYSQDELIMMINKNEHLDRVVLDRCQLVQDIEARAEVLNVPAYQFLWGDMLAWGVCVEAEPARGVSFMRAAADQGLPAALEQLGRYYANGTLVQEDKSRAVVFLREASALGNMKAQMQLADLFIAGYGSPYDYQDTYHWLYNAITDDKDVHARIANQLAALEKLMHPKAVKAARQPLDS
ncbi:tetratricopeptide repeat protein [Alteromonas sp. ASW11-36]|uniref:Tetratricopeptide repeat protein n=1 Tax=Alteromonas arenosi TaxID=3055817 RepID=A0ABT7SYV0_9ALTE|nr:tetratricopeptide repeat protein [Alteromonas sp. ASW11-36]MDM7861369.1 tetratricopeptide repeat protein [Alteromonas sp. ASW11-36]